MKRLGYVLVALALTALGAAGLVAVLVYRPVPRFGTARTVSIRRGSSMTGAARELADAGIIRSELAFVVYAEWTGLARRLKPGDYRFTGGEAMPAVLSHLVNGDFMVVTVTIPEGMTIHQIGQRMEQAGLGCQRRFDAAARRGRIVTELGLGPLGAEGFLFPATYRFSPLADTDRILEEMLERFFDVLTPEVESRMFELGLTAREMVTLASIIEKEAKAPAERPIIASVFYNRLKRGMPLQSDPTAQYNLEGDPERAATAVRIDSAFNTYEISGLPPGPIANPGLPSIEAALYPAHTDYLYFVARDDGTHIFSRTFAEHQRAIAQIRRLKALARRPKG